MEIKDIWGVADAELNNLRASLQKSSQERQFIDRLISLYKDVPDSFAQVYPRERIPILQMFWTCFRGFLISTELTLQGHFSESYTIASKSAETVAIAQKFNLFPDKIEGWIKRNKEEDQPFRRLLGKLFPENDPVLQPDIFNIYELTSEYGRHPNFSATIFYSNFDQVNTTNTVLFDFNDYGDETNFQRVLNYTIHIYCKYLVAYSKILGDYLNEDWKSNLDAFNKDFNKYKETLRLLFEA